jgi:hypothetical protein
MFVIVAVFITVSLLIKLIEGTAPSFIKILNFNNILIKNKLYFSIYCPLSYSGASITKGRLEKFLL